MDEIQADNTPEEDKLVDLDEVINEDNLTGNIVTKDVNVVTSNLMDETDVDNAEISELPYAVIENDEISSELIPELDDEFTCVKCFLVKHYSALNPKSKKGAPICVDCA